MERLPSTNIRVIIIGAGFAGLTAAIECHRKGHDVLLLESFPELKILGDVISFGPNAGRIFCSWPGMEERLDPILHDSDGLSYKTWIGEDLFTQYWDKEDSFGKKINGHRGEIHEHVFNYALEQGIEIRLGQKVQEYFETDTEAGVVVNGERISGDAVFAADGVRSRGRQLVLGYDDKPKSSGYAVYRAWFDSSRLKGNPRVDWMIQGRDKHCAWLGPDVHFIAATVKESKDFSWVCTHKVGRGLF